MLFHLLIVDDEPTIRKGLSRFIPWDSIECSVDAVACNGLEAVEKIKQFHPDIVITDVKMPQMDGIELAKYIHENYRQIKVIVLTGHAEFQYAQSAIQYRVSDFIVKPTSREKLMEAVHNCKTAILNEKNENSLNRQEIFYLKEHFLTELTTNSYLSKTDVSSKLEEYKINLSHYFLVIYQFSAEQYTQFHDNFIPIRDILTGIDTDHECYRYHHNFVIVLYNSEEKTTAFPDELETACREGIDIISDLYGVYLTAGASGANFSYEDLKKAYSQAVMALSYDFYNDSCFSVYNNSYMDGKADIDAEYMLPLYDIENALNSWDFESAESLAAKLFIGLKVNFTKAYDIKNICSQIFYICSRILMKKDVAPPEKAILQAINQSTNIFQLQEIISHLFAEIKSTLSKSGHILSPSIEEAIAYINQNISSNLSLEVIAEHIHIHTSYLSRLFKKDCGISLTDYINKQRIELAKELLSYGNILSYEIAEQVGYNDPAYFSATFKKYTGLTPKEFRQQQLNQVSSETAKSPFL